MATSTFDKRIIVSNAAAKRLSAMFATPAKPLPNISKYLEQSETAWLSLQRQRRGSLFKDKSG
ncbi:MAG: hypothetical protein LBB36_06440 [Fibromonadaceae bacterium]|nr:hypothetical protein [Fibromonadaceae bacterium]